MSSKILASQTVGDLPKRRPWSIYFTEPSLTVQADKDECDINKIVARALKGMDITHVNSRVARYGDFSNVPDYQQALDLVNRAEGMFRELPAEVRERFSNDPAKMVEFLQNDKNYDEAVKLGLVVKKPAASNAAEPAEAAAPAALDAQEGEEGEPEPKPKPKPKK